MKELRVMYLKKNFNISSPFVFSFSFSPFSNIFVFVFPIKIKMRGVYMSDNERCREIENFFWSSECVFILTPCNINESHP